MSEGRLRPRDLLYTAGVLLAVAVALLWPRLFLTVAGIPSKRLLPGVLMLIMFGVGTAMSVQDFLGVARMPKAVLVGIAAQFLIMPLLGFTLAHALPLSPEVAAGVILIGAVPCGLSSNVMCYIARGNLALSIALTAVATLLAPVLTPLWMRVLAHQFVPIDALAMMRDILMLTIAPIALGLVYNRVVRGRVPALDAAMPVVAMLGIIWVIGMVTAGGRAQLLAMGPWLVLAVLAHNVGGYLLGYWGARLAGLDERSCRTVSIEVGMQNGGLATGLAHGMGKVATVGLAPAVFASLMNITGSILANWWRTRANGRLLRRG